MLLRELVLALWAIPTATWAAALLPTPTPTAVLPERQRQLSSSAAPSTTAAPTDGSTYTSTDLIIISGFTNPYVTMPDKTIEIALPTCVRTAIPDENGHVPPGSCGAIWNYYPSFNAAAVFAALFGIVTAVHLWQAIATKKRFCWVIVMAGIWETLAFTFRAVSAKNQISETIYLVYQIFILLSPLWVNAFDYMVLGRMIYYFLPDHTLFSVPASTIAAIFVSLDFISFIVQLVGGSSAGPTSPPEEQLKAVHIYMGGIGLQQFFIVVFVVLAAKFQVEMGRMEKQGKYWPGMRRWRPLLYAMYASLTFITVRIVFRLVEFSRGANEASNPILTVEAYFYVLEAAPMLLALLSFNIAHPGKVLVGPESEMPGFFATLKGMMRRKRGMRKLDDGDSHELAVKFPDQSRESL